MKLYEIDQAISAIFEAMSVDEETGEVVLDEEALAELQEERTKKLEGAALYTKDLDAMAKAIREEEKALAARRQAMEKKSERIKAWIAYNLGDEKIETPKVKLSIRKAAQITIIDDAHDIQHWYVERFCKTSWEDKSDAEKAEIEHVQELLDAKYPAPVYSKAGLKKLIAEGYEITGAHVEDGKPSLQIK